MIEQTKDEEYWGAENAVSKLLQREQGTEAEDP